MILLPPDLESQQCFVKEEEEKRLEEKLTFNQDKQKIAIKVKISTTTCSTRGTNNLEEGGSHCNVSFQSGIPPKVPITKGSCCPNKKR